MNNLGCKDCTLPVKLGMPKSCYLCYCEYVKSMQTPINDEPTTAQAPELQGIVNRPQFDLDYYSVNSAVHVTEAGRKGVEEFNGIVIKSEPCELSVAWFDEDGDANDDYDIVIDDVINGDIKIRKLV